MLGRNYKDAFLEDGNNKSMEYDIKKIVEKEEVFGINCINWKIEQHEKFLRSFNSVSSNYLAQKTKSLNKFTKYICEKEGVRVIPFGVERNRIDMLTNNSKRLSTVINNEEYKHIVSQLEDVRDRLIFSLAWSLLTTKEIRNLKESDIEIITNEETGIETAKLRCGEKYYTIVDPDIIEDIKNCKNENEYQIESSDGKSKIMKFKDIDYLIKPMEVGKKRKGYNISNPSKALLTALESKDISCVGIDVQKLNIKDIRHSKIIYLLSEGYSKEEIMKELNSGKIVSHLSKLSKLVKLKYEEKFNNIFY